MLVFKRFVCSTLDVVLKGNSIIKFSKPYEIHKTFYPKSVSVVYKNIKKSLFHSIYNRLCSNDTLQASNDISGCIRFEMRKIIGNVAGKIGKIQTCVVILVKIMFSELVG